jgi:large subunit ribosomal protein L30
LPSRKLRITLTRSLIGLHPKHAATLRALGLRKIRVTVEREDTPTVRGMLAQVPYAVRVEEPQGGGGPEAEGRAIEAEGRRRRDQKNGGSA